MCAKTIALSPGHATLKSLAHSFNLCTYFRSQNRTPFVWSAARSAVRCVHRLFKDCCLNTKDKALRVTLSHPELGIFNVSEHRHALRHGHRAHKPRAEPAKVDGRRYQQHLAQRILMLFKHLYLVPFVVFPGTPARKSDLWPSACSLKSHDFVGVRRCRGLACSSAEAPL